MEKHAARIGAQVGKHTAHGHRTGVLQPHPDRFDALKGYIRHIFGESGDQPGGVDGADNYLLLQSTIGDGVYFLLLGLSQEAGRDQHQVALARHSSQATNRSFYGV